MNYWDKLMTTDEDAARYMDAYGEGPGFATRVMVGQFVNNGESVLDVGCGPGWNMDHFAQYGPALSVYKGVDYSERFVRVCNKRRLEKKLENFSTMTVLPFELQDCRDLKEPDNSWDVVVLQDCLEHTNGYEKPVHEALRVARKRVIISFWHLSDDDNPHINNDGDDGWGAWYDKREWEKFLNTLPYVWHHTDLKPPEKVHSWNFYIIDKES